MADVEVNTRDNITCDGCAGEIKHGEAFLNGIRSCCGPFGCVRALCVVCVKKAADELAKRMH